MKKISNNEYFDLIFRWQVLGKSKANFAEDEYISRTNLIIVSQNGESVPLTSW
jgi:hypothetical protein